MQEFQARQLEESKLREHESEAHSQKVAQLSAACDSACNKFDQIKAQQSANCDRAAAMAMREVRAFGANPMMLGAAKQGVEKRSLSGKRQAVAVNQ